MLAMTLATLATPALPASAERGGPLPAPAGAGRTDTMVKAVSAAWFKAEWDRYAGRFVSADGRVIDNANGGVSHSEGQGYGLVLAAQAGDAARFDALWRWTEAHLMVRKDGLAAWQWNPATGSVADGNNATDGDILLAWGLWSGARRFQRPDYRTSAERLARSLGASVVKSNQAGPYLLPGVKGFRAGEQPDGPVVNLSYWVFPAFTALGELAPGTDWGAVKRNGLALLDASRFGPLGLPTEWESLAGRWPRPARGFPEAFGYNAIRIPLYLALDGEEASRRALNRFAGAWTRAEPAAAAVAGGPAVVPPLRAAGYDLIFALARCAAAGQPIPPEMINTRSDLYYPETLRLLAVLAIQERFPACL